MRLADGGETVGDDERRAVLRQLVERMLNFRLGQAVQRRGRLVQDQHRRVFQENARDGDALLLSAGQECAAFADVGVEAVRHCQNVVVNFRPFRGLHDLVHRRVGPSVADVFQNGVGKQKYLLLHDADVLAQAVLRQIAHVMAVYQNGAIGHVVKARDELAERGLAAAGWADDRDGLTRLDVQRHAVQNVQLLFICERHVLHVDPALDVVQLQRVRLVLQHRLRAHDLQKAGEARRAVCKQLGEVGQPPDGVDERGDVKAEGDQVDVIHIVLHDEHAAHRDDRHGKHGDEQLHHGVEQTHLLVEHALGGLIHIVRAAEFFLLQILAGKRLGCAHTGEAGLDVGVDRAGFLLDEAGGLAHGAAAAHDDDEKDRDHDAHDQRQPPFDREHDGQRARDGDHRDEDILRAVVRQLCDLKEVGGQAAHELAGAVAVVEVEAQLLHVREQRVADIGLDADAERVAPVADDKIQAGAQNICQHHDPHDKEEGLVGMRRKELLHGRARDDGVAQVDQRHHQRAEDIQNEQLPVRLEERQEDRKAAFFLIFFRCHGWYSVSLRAALAF